jgi:hypothetical protein
MSDPEAILKLGIDAAREGNREEARSLFTLLTRQDPNNVQGWLWLAGVAEGPEQRRAALERAVEIEPDNEMALKGLQAMGVAPAAAAAPTPAAPPPIPERELSDEERYAAELDSAFDDYDSVPRAPTPTRPTADEADVAEERRAGVRVLASDIPYDDAETEPARTGLSPLMLGLLGLIAIALIALLVVWFLGSGQQGSQVATNPTLMPAPTVDAGAGAEPTAEGGAGGEMTQPTPAEGGEPGAYPAPGEGGEAAQPTPAEGGEAAQPTPAEGGEAAQPTPPPTSVGPPPESANPALIPAGTNLDVNGWTYSLFPNIVHGAIGNRIGATTAQGNFVIVLVLVGNNTGTAQPLPADFFVLKDAQGQIYTPSIDASNAYVQRGVNADVGIGDTLPANGILTSVPLIFDVPPGASNLVIFARAKTDQGWLAAPSVP